MANFFSKMTVGAKIVLGLIAVGLLVWGLSVFAPGLIVSESVTVDEFQLDNKNIDNQSDAAFIELPSTSPSTAVAGEPLIRFAGYAWDCEMPMITGNGGNVTMKGSLMERENINFEFVRQDWLSELKTGQLKFLEMFDKGVANPCEESDKAYAAIVMMGDGAPWYLATVQQKINEVYGEGKYHAKVIGAMGMSDGQDKLIGPPEWKTNPQTMRGSVISVVVGDGDWVVLLNYAAANKIPVNPNTDTYDANAINIYPSENDDYIKSAEELIKSQNGDFVVELKEVVNGKLTGKTVERKIDGCATWTPGDVMVFDALTGFTDIASTKDFPNQMATTIIAIDEWCQQNSNDVSAILRATLTASNQLKQYDQWRRRGAEALAQTFKLDAPANEAEYWYNIFNGQSATKAGITYNMGGGRVLNYDDVLQYYGYGADRTNRYRAVYEQVSGYITTLNPFNFNENVPNGVVPYKEAVNLSYLLAANVEEADRGVATTYDYTTTKTNVLAKADYRINFTLGSAEIQPSSYAELNGLYNQLLQAEQSTLKLVGYTDVSGDANRNLSLSERRANSVVQYLSKRGIPNTRFQSVEGLGEDSTYPVASENRRVEITLLQ